MVDATSLALLGVAIGAIALVFAFLQFLEARRQRQLMEVMVKSLAFIEKRPGPKRPKKPRKPSPRSAPPAGTSPAPILPAPILVPSARLELERRKEDRRNLELQLRQKREEWKRQKDVAKAIGWVLDRLSTDDDEDEEGDEDDS